MDPNTTLREARHLAAEIVAGGPQSSRAGAEKLAEYLQAMDTWLLRGGFLPYYDWRMASLQQQRAQQRADLRQRALDRGVPMATVDALLADPSDRFTGDIDADHVTPGAV